MFYLTYEQAVEWVNALPRLAENPGVYNTKQLLKTLNNPDEKLKFIHVAGTNGKGSTTMMISSILRCAGYKVGTTISPYVLDFTERFLINCNMVCKEKIAKALTKVRQAAMLQGDIVAFDAVTAAAILIFYEEKCDIVCLETGLGGRLDSTNAVQNTLVACITAIGKDHTELLGDTIEKIAREKCGIIKNNCEVVSYPLQNEKAMHIIERYCNEQSCVLNVPNIDSIEILNSKNDAKYKNFEQLLLYENLKINLPLCGIHQVYNATVAIKAVNRLSKFGYNISGKDIITGIENVKFAARIEIVCKDPLIIIDGAHNAHGVNALVKTLSNSGVINVICVVGTLKGKDVHEMMKLLSSVTKNVFTVMPENTRGLSEQELALIAENYVENVETCFDIKTAIQKARKKAEQKNMPLLICGSLYLASVARKILVK